MKVEPVGMWVTPATQKELYAMVEGLQSPEAIHAMMFTWNYFAKVYKYEDENGTVCDGCDIDCHDCVGPESTSDNHCDACGSDLTKSTR